jgi:hypothetical protein
MNRLVARKNNYKAATMAMAVVLLLVSRIIAVSTSTLNTAEVAHPATIEPAPHGGHGGQHGGEEMEGNFYFNLFVVFFCTCTAGLMSGLTIGLAAVDRLTLELDEIGNDEVKKMTSRIFPVIDQHHWMLVTLLLCNAGAMETLPIYLDRVVP